MEEADRLSHVYVIGKTGTGKSTLLETMIRQDVERGQGLALVDPHGDLVERVAAAVPAQRLDDLIYLNAPDPGQPYGYNPLKRVRADKRSLAASGMLEVLKKMWSDAWGVRMEHILRNALLALLEQDAATLPDLLRLLGDDQFRKTVAARLSNPPVREFWLREYPKYPYRYRAEAIAPIQNKVGAYLADPKVRKILTAPEKPIRIRQIMDEGRILLINLAKGKRCATQRALRPCGSISARSRSCASCSRSGAPRLPSITDAAPIRCTIRSIARCRPRRILQLTPLPLTNSISTALRSRSAFTAAPTASSATLLPEVCD